MDSILVCQVMSESLWTSVHLVILHLAHIIYPVLKMLLNKHGKLTKQAHSFSWINKQAKSISEISSLNHHLMVAMIS